MLAVLNSLWGRILGGVAVGLLILAIAFWSQWRMADTARARAETERDIAQAANQSNQETINALQAQQSLEGRILGELRDIRAGIVADTQEWRNQLDALASENPDVQADLDYRYSPELVCLRDAANGVANPDCLPVSKRGASTDNAGAVEPR